MDIKTPKGRITLEQEARAARIYESNFPGVTYSHTPKDEAAKVDAFLTEGNQITAVIETKCRSDMTVKDLRGPRGNRLLVTEDKIQTGKMISKSCFIPFYLFLYFTREDRLLVQEITGKNGLWSTEFYSMATPTQGTVNGGTAVRDNAYIDMSDSTEYWDVSEGDSYICLNQYETYRMADDEDA